MNFGNMNIRDVLNKNSNIRIERNPYCLKSNDILNETYFTTSRNISYGSDKLKYFSIDMYAHFNNSYTFPLKLFGMYDKLKHTFIPIYVVDKNSNDIFLLLDWIGVYNIQNNNIRYIDEYREIETIHRHMLMNIMDMFVHDKIINKTLSHYHCNNVITNKIMPLSSEDKISLQYDLMIDFVENDLSPFINISENLNRILLYESFFLIKDFIIPILRKLESMGMNDEFRSFDLKKMSIKKKLIAYGNVDFTIDKRIVNVSKISNELYKELIRFIIGFIDVEFMRISVLDKLELKGFVLNHRYEDTLENLMTNIEKLKFLLSKFGPKERIEEIIKLDNFSLLFKSKNCIYHINLMLIPLSTFLID